MRVNQKSRPALLWLALLLGLFLIVPALSLGQLRSSASNFSSPQTGVSFQNNPSSATSSVDPNYAYVLGGSRSVQDQPIGTAPLTYHDGPVEHKQVAYAIFWLPSGYHYEPAGSDSIFESLISRYFDDVGGSNVSKLLVQYPDDVNASPTTSIIFGGGFVDTTPYPHAGSTTAPLLGQDVTNEILKVISSGALPTGINDAYYVFTANGINVCEDQGMTHCTFSTAAQPVGFCAYHSFLQSGSVSPYALLAVNPGITGGCQISSAITTIFPNSDSLADSEISLTSQEQVNIQTDPYLSAWFDTANATGEISDKCAGVYGTVNATDGHNFIMNNHKYIIQEEWSNTIGGCTLIPPPTASITVSLLPYAKSNTLTPSNFFPLTYAIGKQLIEFQYTGGAVTIQADPNTSLSISPMSSRSNSGLEKWCLNVSCQGDVVSLVGVSQNIVLSYYDLLEQNVYEVTSDSSQPTTFATISYQTAPSIMGFNVPSASATISLAGYSQYIWVQRDSSASVSSQPYTKSTTERWINPVETWNVSQPFLIPLIISYHQYLMNFNYTVVPTTTAALVGPTVTYTSNGTTYSTVVPNKVWADAGSSYSFNSILGSSTNTERWIALAGTGSGTVSSSATASNAFYNQFLAKVSYKVVGALGSSNSAPMFTGRSFGANLIIPLNATAGTFWLDGGSSYSVMSLLPGSNSTDRWIYTQNATGAVNSQLTLDFTYFHQFALNFSYAIVGGGSPQFLPTVNYSSTNGTASLRLSNSASPVWVNAGSSLNVSSVMASANSSERWAYNAASKVASTPGVFVITLYHQFQVGFSIVVVGGGSPNTAPTATVISFGHPISILASNTTTLSWLDAGSSYSLPNSLGSSASERWLTLSKPTGVINSAQTISVKYYNQYLISLGYSVSGGPDPSGGPSASVVLFGNPGTVVVNQTTGQVWADAGSTISLPAQLPGSNSGERWATNSTVTGMVAAALSLVPSYAHQFMVTLATSPAGIPVAMSAQSGWYSAGASLVVQPIAGRGWNFESWTGTGAGAYSGGLSSLIMTVTSSVSETANFYTALTITAPSTGSVSYSFGNVTGTVGTGQSKVVFVPPGQILSMSAIPFPVFYAFSSWSGNITGGPNATTVSQNPLTFSVNSPSSLAVTFRLNLLGIIIVVVVVIVAVVSVLMLRRRNRPEEEEYPEEYAEGGTLETIEGSENP